MLLSYNQLNELVGRGVITNLLNTDQINGSSIDVRLGDTLLIESTPTLHCPECDHEWNDPTAFSYKGVRVVTCPECLKMSHLEKAVLPVDFSKKEPIRMREVSCKDGYVLQPGHVCLGHSAEVFNLPLDITAEYRLKSSMARVFLEHLHAGFCDPGWNGSVLTLEFANMSRYHPILLRAGDKCGQVCFYSHEEVPLGSSYSVRGQYNNDTKATASKGVR